MRGFRLRGFRLDIRVCGLGVEFGGPAGAGTMAGFAVLGGFHHRIKVGRN
jgi:hypothetical protein